MNPNPPLSIQEPGITLGADPAHWLHPAFGFSKRIFNCSGKENEKGILSDEFFTAYLRALTPQT